MDQQGTLLENSFLLPQVVDKYLIRRMITNKKYYPAYLTIAGDVWRELFKNTLFATQSEWLTLKRCSGEDIGTETHPEKLYYIDVPKGTNRIFSVCEEDECSNIVPLFYNSELNILPKPKKKKCKCLDVTCDCNGEFCEDITSLSKTTKLLFTINGVDYYEVIWLKVCPNGDIVKYRTVPTKKYNSFTGDGGDYNNDYNDDYSIGSSPFTNYAIVTETFQEIICKLDVKECGCPRATDNNRTLFNNACCGFMNCCSTSKKRHCETAIGDVNDNGRGHVKVSECGTKIYYKPTKRFWDRCNGDVNKLPQYLLLNYQTTGQTCNTAVFVPEYCLEAMMAGIDSYSKMYNNSFGVGEKKAAEYRFKDEQNKVISFLNPLSLSELANVQDNVITF